MNNFDIATDKLVSYAELSKVLSIPQGTLRVWVYKRMIPHYKFGTSKGSQVRFNPVEINEWIRSNYHPRHAEASCQK